MFQRIHRSRLLITVLGTTVLGTAILGTARDAPAQGYSPADRAFLEGSGSTNYPLGRFNARVQQLHGDLPPGAQLSVIQCRQVVMHQAEGVNHFDGDTRG